MENPQDNNGPQENQLTIAPPNGIPSPSRTGRGSSSGNSEFTWSGIQFSALKVNAGEDIAGKIMSFCQAGPRDVCILAGCGAVSHVTVQQPLASELETLEGLFWILSLSGLFVVPKRDDPTSRMGCITISLCGPDGRVVGGRIAGTVTAAMPVLIYAYFPDSCGDSQC
ncbi:hypothetical protein L6164_027562 [Bauhinia variegata]|uniref:Uncharacterized protein n=1 Tax=Bauhinia variegata TaxID=167791 RepID=A0ACB9LUY8_BAUVA|nr:hypothetical protein L6164_027562 [Bauhinia variegata]